MIPDIITLVVMTGGSSGIEATNAERRRDV